MHRRWAWSVALGWLVGFTALGCNQPSSTLGMDALGNAAAAGTSAGAPPNAEGQAGVEGPAVVPEPDASVGQDVDAGAATPEDAAVGGDGSTDMPEPGYVAPMTSGSGSFQSLTVDGNAVSVYVPKLVDVTQPVPVLFSLHGLSIPAMSMADITGLPALADAEGFVAVFPAGSAGTWNTGGAACGLGAFAGNAADDLAYVEHILEAVEKLQPVDHDRVFVSGFSMGGYATNALACKKPELFRAVAAASGGYPAGPCGAEVVPAIIFHGTADGTISHDCGVAARDAWVKHNGCSTDVDAKPVMGGTCEWSRGCPAGGEVVFCSFTGMPHGWAGSVNPFAAGGTQFESATALMWDFFKRQL